MADAPYRLTSYPLRLYDRGVVRRDVLQMLATNVRHPHDFRGDLAAMIGSANVGQRRFPTTSGAPQHTALPTFAVRAIDRPTQDW